MKVIFIVILTAVFCLHPLFGQGSAGESGRNADLVQGEEHFIHNRPEDALPYLQQAFVADQSHIQGALYLAMAYEQLGQIDEALAIYRMILPSGQGQSALIACNMGNIYFRTGQSSLAEQFYSQAIRLDPSYAPAWLNRANLRIRNGSLREAIPDYERYLSLEPASSQRPQIEQLVGLIRQEFAAQEIRRLMAEEAARADAERRQQLIDQLAASLQAQADETEGIAAGAEELSGYVSEFELE